MKNPLSLYLLNSISLKVVAVFFFFSLIFTRSAYAQEVVIDPTQEYTVHSSPGEEIIEKKAEFNPSNDSQLVQHIVRTPYQDTAKNGLSRTLFNFSNKLEQTGSSVVRASIPFAKEHVTDWFAQVILSSLLQGNSFFFNPSEVYFAQHILKSTYDMYIRISVAAFSLSHTSADHNWIEMYAQNLTHFERFTHWQLGPLNQDLVWFGGALLVVGVFFGQDAVLAHPEALTGLSAVLGTNISLISKYIAKETKSAFTETEKECKDREDNCALIEDKGIILLFNYLPGSMPDLGLDDALISIKNKIFPKNLNH